MSDHIADKSEPMVCCNLGPDLCKVGKVIVPFEICQVVTSMLRAYSDDTHARSGPVMKLGSVVACTLGNMGQGFFSGVALGAGHAVVLTGDYTVLTNGLPTARHGDFAMMNVGG